MYIYDLIILTVLKCPTFPIVYIIMEGHNATIYTKILRKVINVLNITPDATFSRSITRMKKLWASEIS